MAQRDRRGTRDTTDTQRVGVGPFTLVGAGAARFRADGGVGRGRRVGGGGAGAWGSGGQA